MALDDALNEIRQTGQVRLATLPAGAELFRARLRHPLVQTANDPFTCAEMSAPGANGGPLNAPGIPALYFSADAQTAVAETQPWTGAEATVATFRASTSLRLYNFASQLDSPADFLARCLAAAFAVPANEASQPVHCATQFVCEQLKAAGPIQAHGIQYPSALRSGGVNIVLFGGAGLEPFNSLVACQGTEAWAVSSVQVAAAVKQAAAPVAAPAPLGGPLG